ncbi:MAG: HK97 family phage prohead protease [Methanosarcinales archaeon]
MSEYVLVPLEQASEYAFREAVYYSAPCFVLKSEKSRFVIAGYASVNVVDKDNEKITPEALKEAFEKMMKRKSRRNLMLHHQNIQIGEILPKYVDKNGKVWRSGVDEKGLFIVAEVFDDTVTGREVIERMKKGELMSFSIGGRVLPGGREVKCDEDRCWTEIVRLELYEVTSCDQGKNPKAKAFILEKQDNADEDWDDNLGETFINTHILKEERSKMEEEEKIEKAEVATLIEEVKKLTGKLNEVIVRAENEKKLEKEIEDFAVILDVVDKESYRSFMKNCMKSGKSMKECALEWKKKNKAKPAEEEDEDEVEEKAKKKKKKKPEYYYYKYPEKEDFESEEEYKKAVEEFNKLKAQIVKELGLENAEEVIKKSVQPKSSKFEEVNLEEIRKKADEAMDFRELMYLVGE